MVVFVAVVLTCFSIIPPSARIVRLLDDDDDGGAHWTMLVRGMGDRLALADCLIATAHSQSNPNPPIAIVHHHPVHPAPNEVSLSEHVSN